MVGWRGAAAILMVAGLLGAAGARAAGAEGPAEPLRACGTGGGVTGLTSSGPWVAQDQAGAGSGPRVTTGLSADGSAVVRATAGDLAVTKTVDPSGRFTIRLRRGTDLVQIAGNATEVVVTRRGRSVRLEAGAAGEDEFLAVKSLLAGSRSVRAFRVLAAGIGSEAEQTPSGMALTLTDAMIGLLDGDVTAVHRLAERLVRKRAGVRLVTRGEGCYEGYEGEITRAWNDYADCAGTYWYISAWRDACGLRWVLWVESAWFSFVKCAFVPFISS